jgi:isoquinoline 1-oxidoreductase subunit beta
LRHRLRRDAQDDQAPWTVDLRIDLPFAAHASIEPRAALAHWEPDARGGPRLQVFTGTQDLFYVRDVLARRLGLPAGRVEVQACRIGGAFGARTLVLAEVEAALLARAAGRPVKLMWTRAQEFSQGFHRPASSHRVRARVAGGRVTDWWHAFTSSHILFTPAAMPAWMQRAADFVGDQGVARGAALPYAVPRERIEFDALRLPVHGGPWRGLGAGPNGLVVETALDACARASGLDPLAFRLAMTEDTRLQQVLRGVASDARWAQARPGPTVQALRRGRGLACGVYKGGSRVAVVADVEVSTRGEVRVAALWCAHDCGVVIDPDGVRAQVEGCLVWCLGMVLVEALPLQSGGVAAAGFAESPIPRFGEIPPISVRLMDSDAEPTGAGESAMTAGAAAIANAVFDATGQRPTRLPLRPEALAQATA